MRQEECWPIWESCCLHLIRNQPNQVLSSSLTTTKWLQWWHLLLSKISWVILNFREWCQSHPWFISLYFLPHLCFSWPTIHTWRQHTYARTCTLSCEWKELQLFGHGPIHFLLHLDSNHPAWETREAQSMGPPTWSPLCEGRGVTGPCAAVHLLRTDKMPHEYWAS